MHYPLEIGWKTKNKSNKFSSTCTRHLQYRVLTFLHWKVRAKRAKSGAKCLFFVHSFEWKNCCLFIFWYQVSCLFTFSCKKCQLYVCLLFVIKQPFVDCFETSHLSIYFSYQVSCLFTFRHRSAVCFHFTKSLKCLNF